MHPLRITLALITSAVCLLAAGCMSSKKKGDYTEASVRFAFEVGGREVGTQIRLPQSGVVLTISPKFLFTEFDVSKCEAANDELGPVLVFSFTEAAARDLYRMTATNQGLRLVTIMNGVPIGARRIDSPLNSGYFVTNVEVEPATLNELAKNITRTSEEARKKAERQR